uniref:Uncharacterized protein n=2 Tax=Parascaris TaxID=6254 RepID=A0A915CE93_PARUN
MTENILTSISLVEKHFDEVRRLRDSMQNFEMQLKCVEKVPSYSAMAQCSSQWRSKLMAKLHGECNEICEQYAQCRARVDAATAILSEYLVMLRAGQRPTPSYTHIADLSTVLEYLRNQAVRQYDDRIQYPISRFRYETEPTDEVRQAIQRIQVDLSLATTAV